MVFVYNPELFDMTVSEKDSTKEVVFYEDIFCKESTKKTKENEEKGYKRIPLVTAKLNYETGLVDFDKVPAYVTSYKRTNKNGKINITAKITETTEDRSNVGFIAAVPVKGYITGFGFDEGIEVLKAVLKYVDKFTFKDETYTQIVYLVGRTDKNATNLLGNITIDTRVIGKDESVNLCVTEVRFQNEEITQTTKVTATEQGEEAVAKAKEYAKHSFADFANDITQRFAKEFKPNNRRGGNKRTNNGDKKPNYKNKSSQDLVIPDPPYQGDKNSYRNNKKRRKK